ncbi:hypothetical protein GRU63_004497 [Salmonella enterica]|nr:hypothetical protein [Salmonella enterica]
MCRRRPATNSESSKRPDASAPGVVVQPRPSGKGEFPPIPAFLSKSSEGIPCKSFTKYICVDGFCPVCSVWQCVH